jgi:hypothetical protein
MLLRPAWPVRALRYVLLLLQLFAPRSRAELRERLGMCRISRDDSVSLCIAARMRHSQHTARATDMDAGIILTGLTHHDSKDLWGKEGRPTLGAHQTFKQHLLVAVAV